MYNNFFGFKERPFQLVPNPGYLFLSRSHEEAMAHLTYAISHGDGFVSITGEVGTGKTTLCRAFLESLGEDTEIAYIFNPQLDALGLLKSINDEFGISSKGSTSKELIDSLNVFLIEKKTQKKNVLLLVDEAQNLGKEVLEQLRLLSNLETNTSKLLQIILVGQPELQNLLDSFELRQLRQRITLSWYLTPLRFHEAREYIRHRVNIASQKTEDKFTGWAYYHIYKYSQGIPRLINIACDRALLMAFGLNRRKVTGSIARDSIKELNVRASRYQRIVTPGRIAAVSVILLCISLLIYYFFVMNRADVPESQLKEEISITSSSSEVRNNNTINNLVSPQKLEEFLGSLTTRSSRLAALESVFTCWDVKPRIDSSLNNIDTDQVFFQLSAGQNGFNMLRMERNWDLVVRLNLPVVLELIPPGGTEPRFLALIKISNDQILLSGGEKRNTITSTAEELQRYWTGSVYVPWKNFYNYVGDIPIDAPAESVFTLKMLLRDLGITGITLDYSYDDYTRDIIKQIQEKHGIRVDGIVGAQTKIVIYNEKKDLNIPFLSPSAEAKMKIADYESHTEETASRENDN